MGKKNLLFANEFYLITEKKAHEKNAGLFALEGYEPLLSPKSLARFD